MTSLDAFQRTVARALTVLAMIHVPILTLIAWALDGLSGPLPPLPSSSPRRRLPQFWGGDR